MGGEQWGEEDVIVRRREENLSPCLGVCIWRVREELMTKIFFVLRVYIIIRGREFGKIFKAL
jgi:hypothetical protein